MDRLVETDEERISSISGPILDFEQVGDEPLQLDPFRDAASRKLTIPNGNFSSLADSCFPPQ
ncbi:hypothetical protein [Novosphingobium soli]|uniref:Uncharacterized protein n=1 Tax=Novosphingobium soli TaxID=574956 RepID=A0ABV6CQ22_9SPHN